MKPLKNQSQTYQKPSTEAQKTISNKDKANLYGDSLIKALKTHRTEKGYK